MKKVNGKFENKKVNGYKWDYLFYVWANTLKQLSGRKDDRNSSFSCPNIN